MDQAPLPHNAAQSNALSPTTSSHKRCFEPLASSPNKSVSFALVDATGLAERPEHTKGGRVLSSDDKINTCAIPVHKTRLRETPARLRRSLSPNPRTGKYCPPSTDYDANDMIMVILAEAWMESDRDFPDFEESEEHQEMRQTLIMKGYLPSPMQAPPLSDLSIPKRQPVTRPPPAKSSRLIPQFLRRRKSRGKRTQPSPPTSPRMRSPPALTLKRFPSSLPAKRLPSSMQLKRQLPRVFARGSGLNLLLDGEEDLMAATKRILFKIPEGDEGAGLESHFPKTPQKIQFPPRRFTNSDIQQEKRPQNPPKYVLRRPAVEDPEIIPIDTSALDQIHSEFGTPLDSFKPLEHPALMPWPSRTRASELSCTPSQEPDTLSIYSLDFTATPTALPTPSLTWNARLHNFVSDQVDRAFGNLIIWGLMLCIWMVIFPIAIVMVFPFQKAFVFAFVAATVHLLML